MAIINDIAKVCFNLIISGSKIKKTNEGIVIIIVLYDRAMIFSLLLVSIYNHIKANKDVNGIEIINAANKVDLLATSDTKTIIIALTNVFIIIYIFNNT